MDSGGISCRVRCPPRGCRLMSLAGHLAARPIGRGPVWSSSARSSAQDCSPRMLRRNQGIVDRTTCEANGGRRLDQLAGARAGRDNGTSLNRSARKVATGFAGARCGGGRPMRFVPAGEARDDHARVDRDHRRVRSIASLTNSSVSGGSLPSGTATGPAPRQRHGQGRWFDFDPPIPLPDVDDPPRLEAEASPERFGDDHTPGRVDGSSHVKIMPSFVTGSFERVRSERARG